MQKLSLLGGTKVIKYKFKKFNTINKSEINAATKVLKSGHLSNFLGTNSKNFYGGTNVRKLENAFKSYFKVKFAISVNSWTSGLIAAIGSLDIEPGDEIILPTWTMSACASAILNWNAIPVFADIEDKTFCIDPESIKKNISKKTKAILAVDIFGHSANLGKIKKIAKKYKLKIISDTAQAPGALYNGKFAGTISDIGGFSFNYHKHIHCGEGGMIVTNNIRLARRAMLIRNHAESVIQSTDKKDLSNMIGYNFRLGEIESAIVLQQLKKLKKIIKQKQAVAQILNSGLKKLEGIRIPFVKKNCTHVYYVYPLVLDSKKIKVDRKIIVKALEAEGVQGLASSYQNLHLLSMFQKKISYGKKSFPWSLNKNKKIKYKKGICPVAERLQTKEFLSIGICNYDLDKNDALNIVKCFKKVWLNLPKLETFNDKQ
jgi:dTDP-4-amino-4,6-dideoxygalactose transaminase